MKDPIRSIPSKGSFDAIAGARKYQNMWLGLCHSAVHLFEVVWTLRRDEAPTGSRQRAQDSYLVRSGDG